MDKFLIFLDYDQVEYNNYFKFAHNGEAIREYSQDEINELIKYIKDNSSRFELDIIKADNANEWEYKKVFEDDISCIRDIEKDIQQICSDLNAIFDREYPTAHIVSLFSGECSVGKDIPTSVTSQNSGSEEPPEIKPKDTDGELTTLARAIIEKYRRLNGGK